METVDLVGVRADGTQEKIGTVAMPPRMKAREIVASYFGHPAADGDGDSDADYCLAAMDDLLAWLRESGQLSAAPLMVVAEAAPVDGQVLVVSKAAPACLTAIEVPAALKPGQHIIRHNDDGEFGQATGWLHRDGGEPCIVTGAPVYVWRPLDALLATTGHKVVRSDATPAARDGFALVPLRMTSAMERVVEADDWRWEDLLAAAEAITEDQYDAIAAGDPPAADPLAFRALAELAQFYPTDTENMQVPAGTVRRLLAAARWQPARSLVTRALVNCPHRITDECMVLHADPKADGNALRQAVDRLVAAFAEGKAADA